MNKQFGEKVQTIAFHINLVWCFFNFVAVYFVAWLQNKKPLFYASLLLVLVTISTTHSIIGMQKVAQANQLAIPPATFLAGSETQEFLLSREDAIGVYLNIEMIARAYPPNITTLALQGALANWLEFPESATQALATITKNDPIYFCSGNETSDGMFVITCPH